MKPKPPRGIRNCNPGNLRRSNDKWRGLSDVQSDPDFFVFKAPLWGLRAMATVLLNYQRKHGLHTVEQIIGRWAPPNENRTDAYVRAVALAIGVRPDQQITPNHSTMANLVAAIVQHENGRQPYSSSLIEAALSLAGMPQP